MGSFSNEPDPNQTPYFLPFLINFLNVFAILADLAAFFIYVHTFCLLGGSQDAGQRQIGFFQ